MVGPTGRKAEAPLNLESAQVGGPGKVASNIQTLKNKLAADSWKVKQFILNRSPLLLLAKPDLTMFKACLPERFKNSSKRKTCHGLPARQGRSHFTSLPQVLKLWMADTGVQGMVCDSCWGAAANGRQAAWHLWPSLRVYRSLGAEKDTSHSVSHSDGATSYNAI